MNRNDVSSHARLRSPGGIARETPRPITTRHVRWYVHIQLGLDGTRNRHRPLRCHHQRRATSRHDRRDRMAPTTPCHPRIGHRPTPLLSHRRNLGAPVEPVRRPLLPGMPETLPHLRRRQNRRQHRLRDFDGFILEFFLGRRKSSSRTGGLTPLSRTRQSSTTSD